MFNNANDDNLVIPVISTLMITFFTDIASTSISIYFFYPSILFINIFLNLWFSLYVFIKNSQ